MKKNHCKTNISILLALAVTAAAVFNGTASAKISEVTAEDCTKSENAHSQDYSTYGDTVKSQLIKNPNGTFSRIELIGTNIVEEVYSSVFSFISSHSTPLELPQYGGIYATDNYYFVVEGKKNYEEQHGVPEFRIIKYSKSWTRIASADITDANTTGPFDAGSCRFSESNGKLYIHTCHEMYKSSDGLNHQANVTIHLDMETCTVEYLMKDVSNISYGYVSHSFNQFIQASDDGMVYACDHGDAKRLCHNKV